MRARGVLPWLALGALLLLVAAAAGTSPGRDDRPLDPSANGPRGSKAVVVLLEELGAHVEVTAGAPADDADTALVLDHRFDDGDLAELRDWVDGGGVLVVADPDSPLHDDGGDAGCPAALDEVATLSLGPGPSAERQHGTACFDGFVASRGAGAGDVVSVGDPQLFTNRLLDDGDNAVLAAALLAPTGREKVAFLRGAAGSGDERLLDLLGPRVAQALGQVAVAFTIYALWRGRRLGRPVLEGQPVSVAGSELVAAVGRMLGGRQRPGEAAAIVRADLRRALEVRLGLPQGAALEQLADAVADRTGIDTATVAGALATWSVATDDDLVTVLDALDRIRRSALDPTPAGGHR